MKSMKLIRWLRRNRSFAGMLFLSFSLASCARKVTFLKSPVVPAAQGAVKLKKDKNHNYDISLKVIRLAEPERLNPSKDHYVVWMETERNGLKNIGQLESSSGLLSKTLKSSLETVTTFEPASFFITAEDNAAVQYPDGQVVLRTESIN